MKIINQKKNPYHIKNIILISNKRKRALIRLSLYFIFISIMALILLIPNIVNENNREEEKSERFATDLKYVLFWRQPKKNKKSLINKDVEYAPGQSEFIRQNCPYINCYITYNKSLLNKKENFDAIVYDIHDLHKYDAILLNMGRTENQIYIFKSQQPATHQPICHPLYDDFFNWTWTYKLDSDLPHPFINVHNNKNEIIGPNLTMNWITDMRHTERYKSKLSGKSKGVAWLVTNCKTKNKHQDFVTDLTNELSGYNVSVDSYGPCSKNKCPKGSLLKCHKMIGKEYYFSLILEDAFAIDYVTERMVKGMTYFSLPIVSGMTIFTRFFPPGSYINAKSFDLKKLGSIISYLIKNPEKYSFFFDWKSYYYYTTRSRNYVCNLCSKLNEDNKIKKYYKDFRYWWNPEFEEVCQRNELYNMFNDIQ